MLYIFKRVIHLHLGTGGGEEGVTFETVFKDPEVKKALQVRSFLIPIRKSAYFT